MSNGTGEPAEPCCEPMVLLPGTIARRLADAPVLHENDVHLWRLPLDRPAWPLDVLKSYLAEDELDRAEKFVFRPDRERFIVARGYLRTILARYTGCHPREIQFGYGPYGKPHLTGWQAGCGVRFNLSHSCGLGLCAVARNREVGVDLEQMRTNVDALGVANSTFSPFERSTLATLEPERHLDAFYACWTRKEAYIKARGDGLSYPLDDFDVSLAPDQRAVLLRSAEGEVERERWMMTAVDAGAGYAAALVVERPVRCLSLLCWP